MWPMEVSRLGVKLELQLPAYSHSSWQHQTPDPLSHNRNFRVTISSQSPELRGQGYNASASFRDLLLLLRRGGPSRPQPDWGEQRGPRQSQRGCRKQGPSWKTPGCLTSLGHLHPHVTLLGGVDEPVCYSLPKTSSPYRGCPGLNSYPQPLQFTCSHTLYADLAGEAALTHPRFLTPRTPRENPSAVRPRGARGSNPEDGDQLAKAPVHVGAPPSRP